MWTMKKTDMQIIKLFKKAKCVRYRQDVIDAWVADNQRGELDE